MSSGGNDTDARGAALAGLMSNAAQDRARELGEAIGLVEAQQGRDGTWWVKERVKTLGFGNAPARREASPAEVKKLLNYIASELLEDHITGGMNEIIKDLLKEADIPRELWAKTSDEISLVLKRVAETGEPRPKYLKLASELEGDDLEKRRAIERTKKANYRRNAKLRGAEPS